MEAYGVSMWHQVSVFIIVNSMQIATFSPKKNQKHMYNIILQCQYVDLGPFAKMRWYGLQH